MTIFWSKKLNLPKSTEQGFSSFIQQMANRIMQGHSRYGAPDRRKKYLTRAIMELKAYKKTGNMEHLLNTSNYCFLESIEPEHSKHHHNPRVDSVTRGRV